MAAISRKTQKIFGGSLTPTNNIAVFGSLKDGSPAYSGDPSVIQSADYLLGWGAATVANQAPALQDMNALFYVDTYQLAYLLERGVPEWDSATTYYTGDIVNDVLGNLYVSLVDNNTNNAVTDATKWRLVSLTSANDSKNFSLSTGAASSILTINMLDAAGATPSSISSCLFAMRSATSTSGLYNLRKVSSSLSIQLPSGASLGALNSTDYYIYVYVLDNAGTIEMAVSGYIFDTSSIQSTTAISSGSTSASVLYSASARSNVPIKLIGRVKVNESTAGVYASNALEIFSGAPQAYLPGANVGQRTAATIAAGRVGEYIEIKLGSNFSVPTTVADVPTMSLTLTPGVWLLQAMVSLNSGSTIATVYLTDNSNNPIEELGVRCPSGGPVSASSYLAQYINISSSTTYKLRAVCSGTSGDATVYAGQAAVDYPSVTAGPTKMFAIRIA